MVGGGSTLAGQQPAQAHKRLVVPAQGGRDADRLRAGDHHGNIDMILQIPTDLPEICDDGNPVPAQLFGRTQPREHQQLG